MNDYHQIRTFSPNNLKNLLEIGLDIATTFTVTFTYGIIPVDNPLREVKVV